MPTTRRARAASQDSQKKSSLRKTPRRGSGAADGGAGAGSSASGPAAALPPRGTRATRRRSRTSSVASGRSAASAADRGESRSARGAPRRKASKQAAPAESDSDSSVLESESEPEAAESGVDGGAVRDLLKKADRQQKSTASRIARRARRDSADAGSGGGGAGAGVGVAAPVAGAVDGDEDAETKEKRLRADALAVARRVADESLGGVTESAQGLPASAVRYLEYADSKGLAGATVSSAAVQSQELAALQKSTLTAELEKRVVATDPKPRKTKAKDRTDAGKKWFNMPAPAMTPELERDLKLLRMRNYVDPKRFYKAADSKTAPKFFHVGTVVEGPHEYHTSRLTKKERQGTLFNEVFADKKMRHYARKNYNAVSNRAQASGKKAFKRKRQANVAPWKRR